MGLLKLTLLFLAPFAVWGLATVLWRILVFVPEDIDSSSVSRLQTLSIALSQYALDHEYRLPPVHTAQEARASLARYVQDPGAWVEPRTGLPYEVNPLLSGEITFKSAHRQPPVVTFYEPKPYRGTRRVSFLIGASRRLPENDWITLKRASGIP